MPRHDGNGAQVPRSPRMSVNAMRMVWKHEYEFVCVMYAFATDFAVCRTIAASGLIAFSTGSTVNSLHKRYEYGDCATFHSNGHNF